MTDEPVDRAYLRLPKCEALPCSLEQRSTGRVTAWTASGVWSTNLDLRTDTATTPTIDPAPDWPSVDAPTPRVQRPAIDGVIPEIANRSPLPFCGHSELGIPASVPRCFVAAVLAGRPAEAVDTRYGTEGGTSLQIVRFAGSGPILYYEQGVDANGQTGGWFRSTGRLILGVEAQYWSADPIDGTGLLVP